MRIGKVVGRLSLSKVHSTLVGRRWILVVPHGLASLSTGRESQAEELVAVDELGATPGAWIGVSEGMEASFPYFPERKPVDAYAACLIDELVLDPGEVARLVGPSSGEPTR